MSLHGEWGLQQKLSQNFPALNWGLHRQLPNLLAMGRWQDLHPPHLSAVVGNLASELLSCAPDHKCLCLWLPKKLISSRFLGVPNLKEGRSQTCEKGTPRWLTTSYCYPLPLAARVLFLTTVGSSRTTPTWPCGTSATSMLRSATPSQLWNTFTSMFTRVTTVLWQWCSWKLRLCWLQHLRWL